MRRDLATLPNSISSETVLPRVLMEDLTFVFLSFCVSVILCSFERTEDKLAAGMPATTSQAGPGYFAACAVHLDSLAEDIGFTGKMIHIA
jgi:hypothetical protein